MYRKLSDDIINWSEANGANAYINDICYCQLLQDFYRITANILSSYNITLTLDKDFIFEPRMVSSDLILTDQLPKRTQEKTLIRNYSRSLQYFFIEFGSNNYKHKKVTKEKVNYYYTKLQLPRVKILYEEKLTVTAKMMKNVFTYRMSN